jgi:hypothetical protein
MVVRLSSDGSALAREAYADKFRDFNADGFFGNHNREELKMLVIFCAGK